MRSIARQMQSPGCRGVEAVEPLSRRCRGLCRGLSRSVKADSMWGWRRGVEVGVEAVEAVEVSRLSRLSILSRLMRTRSSVSSDIVQWPAKLLIPNTTTRSLVDVAFACTCSPFAQASHGHKTTYAWQPCATAASVCHKVQWCENLPMHFLLSRDKMETNDRGDK